MSFKMEFFSTSMLQLFIFSMSFNYDCYEQLMSFTIVHYILFAPDLGTLIVHKNLRFHWNERDAASLQHCRIGKCEERTLKKNLKRYVNKKNSRCIYVFNSHLLKKQISLVSVAMPMFLNKWGCQYCFCKIQNF